MELQLLRREACSGQRRAVPPPLGKCAETQSTQGRRIETQKAQDIAAEKPRSYLLVVKAEADGDYVPRRNGLAVKLRRSITPFAQRVHGRFTKKGWPRDHLH